MQSKGRCGVRILTPRRCGEFGWTGSHRKIIRKIELGKIGTRWYARPTRSGLEMQRCATPKLEGGRKRVLWRRLFQVLQKVLQSPTCARGGREDTGLKLTAAHEKASRRVHRPNWRRSWRAATEGQEESKMRESEQGDTVRCMGLPNPRPRQWPYARRSAPRL
jgi:hypothetical protein